MFEYEMNTQENEDYWRDAIKYRMEEYWEVVRLVNALKGFYYEHLKYEAEDDIDFVDHETIYDFCLNDKRPFGNKNVIQSIIFNLGWDYKRQLEKHNQPNWVSILASDLYQKVLEEVKND